MVKNLKNKKKKKGFTLIELIIVIAIIAILAAFAIPKFGDIRKDAAFKSDIANAKTIANAATTLLADGKITSTSPIDVDDNTASGSTNEIEGYLQNPPKPQTKGYSKYVVTITGETVSVTMSGTNKNAVNLFPVAATTAP
jgi:type IV pilus assembly protein PilA